MGRSIGMITLVVHRQPLSICRLDAGTSIPAWAVGAPFFSITRTADELSIVCPSERVPPDVPVSSGWQALELAGSFAHTEVGVLILVAAPLAAARVSIMPIATDRTDWILVRSAQLDEALAALCASGHEVRDAGRSP